MKRSNFKNNPRGLSEKYNRPGFDHEFTFAQDLMVFEELSYDASQIEVISMHKIKSDERDGTVVYFLESIDGTKGFFLSPEEPKADPQTMRFLSKALKQKNISQNEN